MTATQNTNVGDGSMQKRLDAGRCPRCDSVLNLHMADGMVRCGICKLQIVDGIYPADSSSTCSSSRTLISLFIPPKFSAMLTSLHFPLPRPQALDPLAIVLSLVPQY